MQTQSNPRRIYKLGRCQDCGRTRNVTFVLFEEEGRYHLCANCLKYALKYLREHRRVYWPGSSAPRA